MTPEPRRRTSRVAVIGDVQGHVEALKDGLALAGVDVDGRRLPVDLVVVQVGDLVHKGPASEEAVEFVDEMLEHNRGSWIQLVGNHEAQYLGGPEFWEAHVTDRCTRVLRRWLDDGRISLAAALSTDDGDLLVTHAGLTFQLWRQLSSPAACGAAQTLNRLLLDDRAGAFRAGSMLRASTGTAGVVWAESGSELYRSWAAAETAGIVAPFGQVHGHTSVVRWSTHQWTSTTPAVVRERAELDHGARHTRVELAGKLFVGIDPGWGAYAAGPCTPLVLEGTLLA